MRLIDADKLIVRFKELKGSDTLANMFVSDVIKEIKKMPTAYDADGVVEKLKDHAIEFESFGKCSDYVELSHAVNIVKGGGADAGSI